MDTLSLRLFVRIADLGNVSSAARDLSLSPASASARLTRLEATVGGRLFTRTTRALSLTTVGKEFLPFAQESLETLDAGLNSISGNVLSAKGLLRMTMPGSFGRMYVVPLLAEFRSRYPDISLDLRLSDEVLDVIRGAFDLIIRNAPLADSGLIARQLAPDRRLLVASPDYLLSRGTPQRPEQLADHDIVAFPDNRPWPFRNGQTLLLKPSTTTNDGEAMRQLIEGGAGIGLKSKWNVASGLRSGALLEVLPDFPLITTSAIWAVYPGGRAASAKVRAMIDFLHEHFSPDPPWESGL